MCVCLRTSPHMTCFQPIIWRLWWGTQSRSQPSISLPLLDTHLKCLRGGTFPLLCSMVTPVCSCLTFPIWFVLGSNATSRSQTSEEEGVVFSRWFNKNKKRGSVENLLSIKMNYLVSARPRSRKRSEHVTGKPRIRDSRRRMQLKPVWLKTQIYASSCGLLLLPSLWWCSLLLHPLLQQLYVLIMLCCCLRKLVNWIDYLMRQDGTALQH